METLRGPMCVPLAEPAASSARAGRGWGERRPEPRGQGGVDARYGKSCRQPFEQFKTIYELLPFPDGGATASDSENPPKTRPTAPARVDTSSFS